VVNQSIFDGFYVAYLTGAIGSSLAMFCFKDGVIAGADVGGGTYSGNYVLSSNGQSVLCTVNFNLRLGERSITGASADSSPIATKTTLTLPCIINPNEISRIETPIGPVNARFEKVQSFT
jgi:hypothetical protein